MIKFFRNIRRRLLSEDKFSKYMIYAAGEIILVVVGILIALQVNIWNENRKAKNNEKILLMNMVENLKSDSVTFSRNIRTLLDIDSLHEQLYKFTLMEIGNEKLRRPNYVRKVLQYDPITKKNDPFIASKIKNTVIRKEILIYFRLIDNIEEPNNQFKDIVGNNIRDYLRQKEVHNLSSAFRKNEKPINESRLINISKEPEFQQLIFEANIKSKQVRNYIEFALAQNNKLKDVILGEIQNSY